MRIICTGLVVLGLISQLPRHKQPLSSAKEPQIAFSRNMIFPRYVMDAPTPRNLFIANLSGTGSELQLTTDDRSENPIWSPDGNRIAFIHVNEGPVRKNSRNPAYELSVMDAGGKNPKRVATFGYVMGYPSGAFDWSPDSRRLAISAMSEYGSKSGPEDASLYVVDLDSAKMPELLVEHAAFPSWSPDGTQIAYSCLSRHEPVGFTTSLCVIGVQGKQHPRVLASHGWYPRWSPDGKRLAYLSRIGDKGQLMTCQPDGSDSVPVTDGKSNVRSFAWSPDGNRIAYTQMLPMEDEVIESGPLHSVDVPRIFVAKTDGTRIGPFGEKDRLRCGNLSWSPNGEVIAAVCTSGLRDKTTRKQKFEESLFVMDSTDSQSSSRVVAKNGVEQAVFSPR